MCLFNNMAGKKRKFDWDPQELRSTFELAEWLKSSPSQKIIGDINIPGQRFPVTVTSVNRHTLTHLLNGIVERHMNECETGLNAEEKTVFLELELEKADEKIKELLVEIADLRKKHDDQLRID